MLETRRHRVINQLWRLRQLPNPRDKQQHFGSQQRALENLTTKTSNANATTCDPMQRDASRPRIETENRRLKEILQYLASKLRRRRPLTSWTLDFQCVALFSSYRRRRHRHRCPFASCPSLLPSLLPEFVFAITGFSSESSISAKRSS